MSAGGPEEERGRTVLRVVAAAAVVLLGGALAALPLVLALLGAVGLTDLVRGRWDPTWNDGDLGIAAAGLLVLVGILAGVGAAAASVLGVRGDRRRLALVAGGAAVLALGAAAGTAAALGLL